nr:polysaccharide biosynthesis/export family protein [Planctomycetota bacterium]
MRIAAVICCVAILAGCFGRTDRLPSYRSTLAVEADLRDVDRPQPTDTPPPAMTLGPGDVLDIQVAGIAGTRERCPIGVDGMLYYGPTDGVRAAGHTLDEIADDLGVALRAWYREPRPAVVPAVLLSRAATVLG